MAAIFFLCLNVNTVPINSVPGYFGYIFQVERIGIIAKNCMQRELKFSSDVFVAVAVVVA